MDAWAGMSGIPEFWAKNAASESRLKPAVGDFQPPSLHKQKKSCRIAGFAASTTKILPTRDLLWKTRPRGNPARTTAVTKPSHGEVAEWSNVPDSKSGVRYPRTVGSNPTLSAKYCKKGQSLGVGLFLFPSDFIKTKNAQARRAPACVQAALRHSDARPCRAALRMAPGSSAGSRLMRWVWTPLTGRCREPGAGRRDPKRSPTYGPMSLWHHMASAQAAPA